MTIAVIDLKIKIILRKSNCQIPRIKQPILHILTTEVQGRSYFRQIVSGNWDGIE